MSEGLEATGGSTRRRGPSGLAISAVLLACCAVFGGLTAPFAFALGLLVLARSRGADQTTDLVLGVISLGIAVVGGVIGLSLLIALALPAVSAARAEAGTALCQSHVLHLGEAVLAYAHDHDDVLPDPASEDELHALLRPYLAAPDEAWTCQTGARYILNTDLAGWALDELDTEYDILIHETENGASIAFPHGGYGVFYFADGAVERLLPEDIDYGGPDDDVMLPNAAVPQPLSAPVRPHLPAAG